MMRTDKRNRENYRNSSSSKSVQLVLAKQITTILFKTYYYYSNLKAMIRLTTVLSSGVPKSQGISFRHRSLVLFLKLQD